MTSSCDKKQAAANVTSKGRDLAATMPVVARTEASTTYQGPCGTQTVEIHESPVNWKDAAGAWHPIDRTLLPGPGGRWKNASGPFSVDLAATADSAPLASLAGGNWNIGFALAGASAAKATIAGETATYHDAMPGIDVQESVTSNGVKESISVKSLPPGTGDLGYEFPLDLSGVTPSTAASGSIVFSAGGATVASLAPAVAWDANKAPVAGAIVPVTQTLVPQGNGWAIHLNVPAAWARNAARALPLTIDPTLTRTGNGSQGCATGVNADQDSFASEPDPNNAGYCNWSWTEADQITHHEDWVGYDNYNPPPPNPPSQQWTYQNFDMTPLIGKDILTADWYDVVIATKAGNPSWLNYFKISQVTSWPPSNQWTIGDVNWTKAGDTGSIGHSSNYHEVWAGPGTQAHANVLSDVVFWANQTVPALGFELDTGGHDDAVHLASDQEAGNTGPSIVVTYNNPPNVPDQLSPASGWTDPAISPRLQAHYYDPDGNSGNVDFEVYGPNGYHVFQPVGTSNNGTPYLDLNATTAGLYSWHVRAWDGRVTSDWSPGWQTFTIGDTAPYAPDQLAPGDGNLSTTLPALSARYRDPDNFSDPAKNFGTLKFLINGVGTFTGIATGGGTVIANGGTGTCNTTNLCLPTSLTPGVYSWQVQAVDANGLSTSSPWQEFEYHAAGPVMRDEYLVNGPQWDTTKWSTTSGLTVVNNQGVFPASTASKRATATAADIQDSEVTFTYFIPDRTAGTELRTTLRGSGGTGSAQRTTGYRLDIPSALNADGSTTISLKKLVNGALSSLGSSFNYTGPGNASTRVRFRVEGSTISAKVWPAGTLEPAAWTLQQSDSEVITAGTLQISQSYQTGSGRIIDLDDVTYQKRTYWGVDSTDRMDQSHLNILQSRYGGKPDFWGRYLHDEHPDGTSNSSYGITAAEVQFAITNQIPFFILDRHPGTDKLNGYDLGKTYADLAAKHADALSIPKTVPIFTDQEQNPGAEINADYIWGWFDELTRVDHRTAGIYAAVLSQPVTNEFCQAAAAHPEIQGQMWIHSGTPEPGRSTEQQAPPYGANNFSCPQITVQRSTAWQYGQNQRPPAPNGGIVNDDSDTKKFDTDEMKPELNDRLWYPFV